MTQNNQEEKDVSDEQEEINEELRQTFPASDPPSRTRAGHERTKNGEDEEEDK